MLPIVVVAVNLRLLLRWPAQGRSSSTLALALPAAGPGRASGARGLHGLPDGLRRGLAAPAAASAGRRPFVVMHHVQQEGQRLWLLPANPLGQGASLASLAAPRAQWVSACLRAASLPARWSACLRQGDEVSGLQSAPVSRGWSRRQAATCAAWLLLCMSSAAVLRASRSFFFFTAPQGLELLQPPQPSASAAPGPPPSRAGAGGPRPRASPRRAFSSSCDGREGSVETQGHGARRAEPCAKTVSSDGCDRPKLRARPCQRRGDGEQAPTV